MNDNTSAEVPQFPPDYLTEFGNDAKVTTIPFFSWVDRVIGEQPYRLITTGQQLKIDYRDGQGDQQSFTRNYSIWETKTGDSLGDFSNITVQQQEFDVYGQKTDYELDCFGSYVTVRQYKDGKQEGITIAYKKYDPSFVLDVVEHKTNLLSGAEKLSKDMHLVSVEQWIGGKRARRIYPNEYNNDIVVAEYDLDPTRAYSRLARETTYEFGSPPSAFDLISTARSDTAEFPLWQRRDIREVNPDGSNRMVRFAPDGSLISFSQYTKEAKPTGVRFSIQQSESDEGDLLFVYTHSDDGMSEVIYRLEPVAHSFITVDTLLTTPKEKLASILQQ